MNGTNKFHPNYADVPFQVLLTKIVLRQIQFSFQLQLILHKSLPVNFQVLLCFLRDLSKIFATKNDLTDHKNSFQRHWNQHKKHTNLSKDLWVGIFGKPFITRLGMNKLNITFTELQEKIKPSPLRITGDDFEIGVVIMQRPECHNLIR